MKYLKYYHIFESLKTYTKLVDDINNILLSPLGISIYCAYVLNNSFNIKLDPAVTQTPPNNSILYNIVDSMKGKLQMNEVCPVFENIIKYTRQNNIYSAYQS